MKINLLFNIRIEEPKTKEHNRQIKQLHASINSIPKKAFMNAIFFIEKDSFTIEELSHLHSLLVTKAEYTYISNERPKNKNEWLNVIVTIKENFKGHLTNPILIMLSHDHSFVKERFQQLEVSCNKFLQRYPNSYYYYSHMPELVSYIYSPPVGFQYKWDNEFFVDTIKLKWLDCHFITSLDGFEKLLSAIIKWPDYAPRLDWKGIVLKPFESKIGFSLTEWCFHQDGFEHFLVNSYKYPDGLENFDNYRKKEIFFHIMLIDLICLNKKLNSFLGKGIIKNKFFEYYFNQRQKFYNKIFCDKFYFSYKNFVSSNYFKIIELSSHKTLKNLRLFWSILPSWIRLLLRKIRRLI